MGPTFGGIREPIVITKERKTEIATKFGRSTGDTGSPEVQIALQTARINELHEHMKLHKKDHSSRRGLLQLVSRRSGLLGYLKKHNRDRYLAVVSQLGLRK